MINMIKLGFQPKSVCWIHQKGQAQAIVAVAEAGSSKIHLLDGRADGKPLHTISNLHSHPVHLMAVGFNFCEEQGRLLTNVR